MTPARAASIRIAESEIEMGLLSNTCTYAIRAALHVAAAQPPEGGFVSTRRIAEDLDVPYAFLTKVLQGLTSSGILVSQRGAAGGVALARPASEVRLLDILVSVGGDGVLRECLLGLPTCSDAKPCALHHRWREERARLEALFSRTTLAEVAAGGASSDIGDGFLPALQTRGRRASPRRAT